MRRSSFVRVLAVVSAMSLLLAIAIPVWGAVLGGTVKSVDARSGVIVVEQRSGGTKTFKITAGAEIQVDGKKVKIEALSPGQTVSVTTSKSGSVTKVSARGGGDSPFAAKPDPKPEPKPEPMPEPKPEPMKPIASNTPRNTPSGSTGTTRPTGGARNAPAGTEWSQYRGPNRENRSAETGLLASWPEDGPEVAYAIDGLGEGYSSVSISGDVLYTMGTDGREEAVFAVDVNTGKLLWTGKTGGGVYQDGTGNGPRGTPTIDGDSVYALGAEGHLVCLDKANGRQKWAKNILSEFQGERIHWGICESPLIDGDKLIVTPGGRRATMAALNKNNGNTLWTAQAPGNPQASYASAVIVEVAGVRQYVNFTSRSIIGVNASNGDVMWGDDRAANGTANCSSVVVDENVVFAASGYGQGAAAVRLSRAGAKVNAENLYHTREMQNHHGGMVVKDGFVYGCNEAVLTCLEVKSGDVAWKNRSVGKGSITLADGHLYVRSEGGPIALVEATPGAYREKSRFDQPQRTGRSAWAHPVVAAGKLFIRDQDKLLAFDVKAK